MKRWLTGALALCGCVMLASSVRAADEKVEPVAPKAPWYKRYLGIGPEPPKPVPVQRRDPSTEAANERALAESHYERRRRVCDLMLSHCGAGYIGFVRARPGPRAAAAAPAGAGGPNCR